MVTTPATTSLLRAGPRYRIHYGTARALTSAWAEGLVHDVGVSTTAFVSARRLELARASARRARRPAPPRALPTSTICSPADPTSPDGCPRWPCASLGTATTSGGGSCWLWVVASSRLAYGRSVNTADRGIHAEVSDHRELHIRGRPGRDRQGRLRPARSGREAGRERRRDGRDVPLCVRR